uniref:Uncharacterized protein n=1 Tax=Hyaloperonospora arabidopsidis (strain Emoy2) TaxID=559515 RepID=M4BFB8_HYAAE
MGSGTCTAAIAATGAVKKAADGEVEAGDEAEALRRRGMETRAQESGEER